MTRKHDLLKNHGWHSTRNRIMLPAFAVSVREPGRTLLDYLKVIMVLALCNAVGDKVVCIAEMLSVKVAMVVKPQTRSLRRRLKDQEPILRQTSHSFAAL